MSGHRSADGGASPGPETGPPPVGSLDDLDDGFIDAAVRQSRDLRELTALLDSGAVDPATAHAIRLAVRVTGHTAAIQASNNRLLARQLDLLILLARRSNRT